MGAVQTKLNSVRSRSSAKSVRSGKGSFLSWRLPGKGKLLGERKAVADKAEEGQDFVPWFTDPDFEAELAVGDIVDYIIRRPVVSPITTPPKDILLLTGHGLGTLAYLRRLYPQANIHYLDIFPSSTSPTIPLGCSPITMNIAQGPIPLPDASVDLVLLRQVNRAVLQERWPMLLKETYRLLRPKGWVEIVGMSDEATRNGPWGREYVRILKQAMAHLGAGQYHAVDRLSPGLEEVGFPTPVHRRYQCPFGKWGGPVGMVTYNMLRGYMEVIQKQVEEAGLDEMVEDIERMLGPWETEANTLECYFLLHVLYTQKY